MFSEFRLFSFFLAANGTMVEPAEQKAVPMGQNEVAGTDDGISGLSKGHL